MRPVAIVGSGKTAFGGFPDRKLRSLAVEATLKCLENGHIGTEREVLDPFGRFRVRIQSGKFSTSS
jgi:acetyl-CoA acetyltransferase